MKVAFKELGTIYAVGELIWCLHCEKVFKAEDVKHVKAKRGIYKGQTFYYCPNDGCNGSALDFFPWEDFRENMTANKFPETPVADAHYPMYPFK